MTKIISVLTLGLLFLSACTSSSKKEEVTGEEATGAPTILYSFVTVGCNRIAWSDDGSAWKSSADYNAAHANLNQLTATFDDVLKLQHTPDYFFFTGDMVLAENSDTTVLIDQLTAWKALYDSHPIARSSVKMVAIPGNHEFLYSLGKAHNFEEVSNPAANKIWLRIMGDFIANNNGPGPGGPDSLLYDERQLTYSLDHKGDHFVIMNTDTYDQPGKTPYHWIGQDMQSYRAANPDGHLFLFGHKPPYDQGNYQDTVKDACTYPDLCKVWDVMTTTRAEAMFSAHEHLFWAGVPAVGKSWQIIAGNGGTKLDAGDFFGFTEVQVMSDGRVMALSHGRPVPDPDYGTLVGATTVRNTFDITWKGK